MLKYKHREVYFMKRIIAVLIVLFILAGCGAPDTAPTTVTKACSIEQAGMKLSISATAQSEEADVDKVDFSMEIPYDAMGIDGSELTDELKEALGGQMESSLLSAAGMEEYEEYVEITKSEFNDDGAVLAMSMDVKKLAEVNATEGEDISLNSFVEAMTASGMTCE